MWQLKRLKPSFSVHRWFFLLWSKLSIYSLTLIEFLIQIERWGKKLFWISNNLYLFCNNLVLFFAKFCIFFRFQLLRFDFVFFGFVITFQVRFWLIFLLLRNSMLLSLYLLNFKFIKCDNEKNFREVLTLTSCQNNKTV